MFQMLIHTEYTQKSPGHYNDDMDWGYNEKLYVSTEVETKFKRTCILMSWLNLYLSVCV